MSIIWELRLYDQAGARVATFDQWPELVAQTGPNRPASYALRLAGDDPRVALFEIDGLLEGWWCDHAAGIDWRREFACWVCDVKATTDKDGVRHFVSSGLGIDDLLARTIIDTYSGSSASKKSGAGETVIKGYVEEQAGPTAGSRARPGLSVEADAALGATWAGQRTNKNLLGVCQEIAEATGLQFGIERTGSYTFEFRVWEPTDRTATVIFSEDRANMGEPVLEERNSLVRNWIKVGGENEGASRVFEYVQDAASVAETPQGRREVFVNASDQDSTAALQAKGEAELSQNRAARGLQFKVLQAPGCRYGLHYFAGDLVTAIYDGVSYAKRIDVARWAVTADGAVLEIETIEAETDGGS